MSTVKLRGAARNGRKNRHQAPKEMRKSQRWPFHDPVQPVGVRPTACQLVPPTTPDRNICELPNQHNHTNAPRLCGYRVREENRAIGAESRAE